MTAAISPSAERGAPAAGGKTTNRGLRRFLAIDTRESFISLAQTTAGQVLIMLTAMLAVAPHFGIWPAALAVSATVAAASRPSLRDPILFIATWATAFIGTALGENDTLDNVVGVLQ